MADKDKLSKDVEEKIQSLASDVYIQVEETLTQLISMARPKDASQKVSIEQEPAYLTLQKNYQISQQEISSLTAKISDEQKLLKSQNEGSAKKISQLEAEHSQVEKELADELTKKLENKQNFQVELTQNKINFTETIERLTHENKLLNTALTDQQTKAHAEQQLQLKSSELEQEQRLEISSLTKSLAVLTEQEQSLIERVDIVEQQRDNNVNKLQKSEASWQKTDELQTNTLIDQKNQIVGLTKQLNIALSDLKHIQEQHKQDIDNHNQDSAQQISQLVEQLQQLQTESAQQKKATTSQQEQVGFLENKINQQVKIAQQSKQELRQYNEALSKLKQRQLEEKKSSSLQQKQVLHEQQLAKQQLSQLTEKNQQLAGHLVTEQADIKLYQQEVSSLKSQVKLAQAGQDNILNRFNANRDKQDQDNNKVRETIKYLRDENSAMLTEHNKHKEQLQAQMYDVENKLTEYRLKFEYAQKQLIKNGQE